MASNLINPNPVIYAVDDRASTNLQPKRSTNAKTGNGSQAYALDELEIFDLLRDIKDPEHPLTLEELHVVQLEGIKVNNEKNHVRVEFTPTVPHCSMATLIGLTIRVQLLRTLPDRFKVDILITPGKHGSEQAINKQLADKERVAAAMENPQLIQVVNTCIKGKNPQE